jgi:hypothetical protein
MNNEQARMLKDVLSRNFPGGTEENYNKYLANLLGGASSVLMEHIYCGTM